MPVKQGKPGRKAVSIAELRGTYREIDERERLSFVASQFCSGKTPSQIHKLLQERYGEEIRREEPYRLLQVGAALGYFHYEPPLEVTLGEKLTGLGGVERAHVVCTSVLDHVTARAAEVLLQLIREKWEVERRTRDKTGLPSQEEVDCVRIGLAGGHTVREIVRALVELLKREDPATVPPSLGFHTVCTGVHDTDSSTDPNAFVTHLLRVPGIETRTFAVPFQAPPFPDRELRKMLSKHEQMVHAKEMFEQVDILVTSGSSWRVTEVTPAGERRSAPDVSAIKVGTDVDDHGISSQLRQLMREHDREGYEALMAAGVVADIFWQPMSFNGPVEIDTPVQAMTLARLAELPELMAGGTKVLLALGPYYKDTFHKADVLLAAMGGADLVGRPLFSHVVCDHRTARAAVRASKLHEPGEERDIA